jgi:hypothetical protein
MVAAIAAPAASTTAAAMPVANIAANQTTPGAANLMNVRWYGYHRRYGNWRPGWGNRWGYGAWGSRYRSYGYYPYRSYGSYPYYRRYWAPRYGYRGSSYSSYGSYPYYRSYGGPSFYVGVPGFGFGFSFW